MSTSTMDRRPITAMETAIRSSPANTTTILVVIVPAILLLVFLWFYLAPLFRRKREPPQSLNSDAEAAMPEMNEHQANSLITWMRRGSRGRFGADGTLARPQRPRTTYRPVSFFSRSSVIPNFPPFTPPPAYATRPGTPNLDYQFPSTIPAVPSPLAPPRSEPSGSTLAPRFFGTRRGSESPSPSPLGRSSLSSRSLKTVNNMLSPPRATRSVSDSTLHPMTTRLLSPSKALVYDRETPGPTSNTRPGLGYTVSSSAAEMRATMKNNGRVASL